MRPPSVLVPAGAVLAAVGISLPVVTIGVHLRQVTVLERNFSASSEQRAYLVGVVVLAVAAWVLPRVVHRATLLGFGLALTAAAGAVLAAVRGWLIATRGPDALETGDAGFLERSALNILDRLHEAGILAVDPAPGLWVLSAGAAVLLVGVLVSLRSGDA